VGCDQSHASSREEPGCFITVSRNRPVLSRAICMMMLRRSRWTDVCWRTALRQHVSLVRTALDSDERALCLSVYNPKGSERHAYRFRVQNWRARSLVSSQTGCDPTTRLLQPITAQNLRADSARSHTLPGDRVSVSVSPAVHSASWVCGPITGDRSRSDAPRIATWRSCWPSRCTR